MITSLLFGDIFIENDKEYIFLAKNENTTNILYCYVTLKTKEFENRCAHLGRTGQEMFKVLKKQNVILNQDDLKQIKDEINISKGVPRELKDLIKNLDL